MPQYMCHGVLAATSDQSYCGCMPLNIMCPDGVMLCYELQEFMNGPSQSENNRGCKLLTPSYPLALSAVARLIEIPSQSFAAPFCSRKVLSFFLSARAKSLSHPSTHFLRY